jgi:hypothetical protein
VAVEGSYIDTEKMLFINSLVKETLVRELSGVILVDAISLAGHTTVTGIVSYNSRNLVGVVRIELT